MSQSKTPDDDLQGLFDDFESVEKPAATKGSARQSPKSRSRKGDQRYRSALNESQTDRRKTAQVTGKKASLAGKYMRRSFTFRPDQLERIEQMAGKLGLSQNDLVRWFTDMGITAVSEGEMPPVTEEVRHRYDPDSG